MTTLPDANTTDGLEPAAPIAAHLRGSAARLAALKLLSGYPGGVPLVDLWATMHAADHRVRSEQLALIVMQALRRDELALLMTDESGARVWFSPAARQLDRLRRAARWQPPPHHCS